MTEFSVLGKDLPRIDGRPKATGEAEYAADLRLPGMLYGRILRSPLPHARIRHIDTSRARALPGVRAVLTGADVPKVHYGVWIYDQTLFAMDKVRYVGDDVAAVAAVDLDVAEEALGLIEVDYEELPAVSDPLEALSPDAPLVHEDFAHHKAKFKIEGRQGNVACVQRFGYGDPEIGFREADEVFENRFCTHAQHQTYLETHAALASYDSSGSLTVRLTTQSVFKVQELLAHLFDLPLNRVRVIGTTVGGGFGGKKPRAEMYAAALSMKTRKPVWIQFSREEDFTATFPRHPSIIDMKTGVKRDGTLTAWQANIILDTGAYSDHGPSIASMCCFHARGPYRVPHVRIDAKLVYTNKLISGAFRGYGNPQAAFAVESQMDIIARSLGIDPLEFRRKNAMRVGDPMVNGQRFPSVRLRETLDQAASLLPWGKRQSPSRPGRRRGVGLACASHPSGGLGSSAIVKVLGDGTVQVVTGIIEIGGGELTVAAQVAAEALGVPYEKVQVVSADTGATPYEQITAASRVTFALGQSVRLAALDAKKELIDRAAEMLEARPEDLTGANGRVFITAAPDRGVTYAQVATLGTVFLKGPVIGKASFAPPSPPLVPENVEGAPMRDFPTHGYVTHIAEVEVDEETGEVDLLRMVCSHDVGQIINRKGMEGQIEGGVAQGIGYALVEEMVFAGGVLTNPTLVDYKVPNILDLPRIDYRFIEEPDEFGPFGAKGIGEAVLVPTAPAIANAVFDATGARIKDLPITPEKVLRALRNRGDGD